MLPDGATIHCCKVRGTPDQARALLPAGTQNSAPPDYSLAADPADKLWNVFNGLGIMAFAYGNTVIPGAPLWEVAWCRAHEERRVLIGKDPGFVHAEIGATAKSPAMRTMKFGIVMGYCIILGAYITVSITGRRAASMPPRAAFGALWQGLFRSVLLLLQVTGEAALKHASQKQLLCCTQY